MSSILQSSTSNRLLALMAPADFELLRGALQPVVLDLHSVLGKADEPISDVYFVEKGIVSQIATIEHDRMEAGLYGREGFGPSIMVLETDRAPYEHYVQAPGHGFKIDASAFKEAIEKSPSLRGLLLRFAHVMAVQVGYTAFSNGKCSILARLARWVLMYQDRLDGEGMVLTHNFLGLMLGVRRAGITDAIHVLEGERMIRSTRGHLRVIDRDKLIVAAECYGKPEAEYERLIGDWRSSQRPEPRSSDAAG